MRPRRDSFVSVSRLSSALSKNIIVYVLFLVVYRCFVSSHKEGRIAIVRKRGMRCGGRGSVRHATVRRAGGEIPIVSEYLAG